MCVPTAVSRLERERALARVERADAITERIFAATIDGDTVDTLRNRLDHADVDFVRAELEGRAKIAFMAADALCLVAVMEREEL